MKSKLKIVAVKKNGIEMKGVIAIRKIKEDEILGLYPGKRIHVEERNEILKSSTTKVAEMMTRWDMVNIDYPDYIISPINKKGQIMSKYISNPVLYINEPEPGTTENVSFIGDPDSNEVQIVADREIEIGEEILVDYGEMYCRDYPTNKYK